MTSRGRRKWLADNQPLEACIGPRQPGEFWLAADLIAACAELAEGLVSSDAHELIARMGAAVDLAELKAVAVPTLSRHRLGIRLRARS